MKHLIDKLTFEIACADEQQAFKIRKDFIKDLYDEMVAVIGACCDHVTDKEQLLQIERLEINLGEFKSNLFDRNQYIKAFGEAFEKELEKLIFPVNKRRTIQQSHVDILTGFLKTGLLPWWAIESEVDMNGWCKEIINGQGSSRFLAWLYEHKGVPEVWERMASQLSPEFKAYIISEALPLSTMAERLSVLNRENIKKRTIIFTYTMRYEGLIQDFVLRNGYAILSDQPISEARLFTEFISTVLPEVSEAEVQDHIKSKGTMGDMGQPEDIQRNRKMAISNPILKEEDKIPAELLQRIMVSQAGIILVAAFLNKFYTNLGLWKEGSWASKDARCKAVYLLHYLATGNTTAYEYQLALEKIICGIPLSESLEINVTVTKKEMEEADDLLSSVIQHWAALKNTSVAGLRHSFLQRQGMLSQKGDNWLLQIERGTMDILLEQLPWGYATVSLPWNQYLIYTEW